jgi:hypothetical protein
MATFVRNSRLAFSELVSVDGIEFWDINLIPVIPVRDDETMYTVSYSDRIDLLANRFYGDPVLWWVLAAANNLDLVPSSLKPGSVLRVPSLALVQEILGSPKDVFS